MKVYTFWHSARSLEDFVDILNKMNIDLLVDLRKKPQSRYYPHFNKQSLENFFGKKYIFGGDFLWGSPDFHNDLLEYIQNRWQNKNNSTNKLFDLIDSSVRNQIFSQNIMFSNNEKRKNWITENFLDAYISKDAEQKAIYFLQKLFEKFYDQKICFFCSEKDPLHCHRYHLLEKKWLLSFGDVEVIRIEDAMLKKNIDNDNSLDLFS